MGKRIIKRKLEFSPGDPTTKLEEGGKVKIRPRG